MLARLWPYRAATSVVGGVQALDRGGVVAQRACHRPRPRPPSGCRCSRSWWPVSRRRRRLSCSVSSSICRSTTASAGAPTLKSLMTVSEPVLRLLVIVQVMTSPRADRDAGQARGRCPSRDGFIGGVQALDRGGVVAQRACHRPRPRPPSGCRCSRSWCRVAVAGVCDLGLVVDLQVDHGLGGELSLKSLMTLSEPVSRVIGFVTVITLGPAAVIVIGPVIVSEPQL